MSVIGSSVGVPVKDGFDVLGSVRRIEAQFVSYEPRGALSVKVPGASGTCLVTPSQALSSPLTMGQMIVLVYKLEFSEARKTGQGQYPAAVRYALSEVTPSAAK